MPEIVLESLVGSATRFAEETTWLRIHVIVVARARLTIPIGILLLLRFTAAGDVRDFEDVSASASAVDPGECGEEVELTHLLIFAFQPW